MKFGILALFTFVLFRRTDGQTPTSCAASPCENGALCEDTATGYQCFCVDGYAGQNCSINFDDCQSRPCRNNGTCTDDVAGFTCVCRSGFTGTECQINIDECESSPCLQNGTCIDLVDGFTCECPSPFRGHNCSLLLCDDIPCDNNAVCENDPLFDRSTSGFVCNCLAGFTGILCETNIEDCDIEDQTLCSGNGLCVDGIDSYSCLCQPGWIGDLCQLPEDDCIGHSCRNGGSCVDQHLGYICICVDGYAGDLCERERDECTTWYPCKNGATCVDQFNDYRCECDMGWFGKNCTDEVNECLQNPCKNGALCLDIIGDFICQCAPFYTGELCETSYNPCAPEYNQCQNGAICVVPPNGEYVCFCLTGFTGTNCEVNVNECLDSPCENNATCEDMMAGYLCHCTDGWTDRHCTTNIDDCVSMPCLNGAVCVDLLNGYFCNCTEDYTGPTCEDLINYCIDDPCRNEGTCLQLVGDYECLCSPPYTGRNCLDLIDECASSPCLHMSTCVNTEVGYDCVCESPYTGKRCEMFEDFCASQPCLNGGSCRQLRDSWVCICPSYLTGRQCTDLVDYCRTTDTRESPCLNGGLCINNEFGFRCVCLFGFIGTICEVQVDFCIQEPCLNSGNCSNIPGGFICDCNEIYTGELCESEIPPGRDILMSSSMSVTIDSSVLMLPPSQFSSTLTIDSSVLTLAPSQSSQLLELSYDSAFVSSDTTVDSATDLTSMLTEASLESSVIQTVTKVTQSYATYFPSSDALPSISSIYQTLDIASSSESDFSSAQTSFDLNSVETLGSSPTISTMSLDIMSSTNHFVPFVSSFTQETSILYSFDSKSLSLSNESTKTLSSDLTSILDTQQMHFSTSISDPPVLSSIESSFILSDLTLFSPFSHGSESVQTSFSSYISLDITSNPTSHTVTMDSVTPSTNIAISVSQQSSDHVISDESVSSHDVLTAIAPSYSTSADTLSMLLTSEWSVEYYTNVSNSATTFDSSNISSFTKYATQTSSHSAIFSGSQILRSSSDSFNSVSMSSIFPTQTLITAISTATSPGHSSLFGLSTSSLILPSESIEESSELKLSSTTQPFTIPSISSQSSRIPNTSPSVFSIASTNEYSTSILSSLDVQSESLLETPFSPFSTEISKDIQSEYFTSSNLTHSITPSYDISSSVSSSNFHSEVLTNTMANQSETYTDITPSQTSTSDVLLFSKPIEMETASLLKSIQTQISFDISETSIVSYKSDMEGFSSSLLKSSDISSEINDVTVIQSSGLFEKTTSEHNNIPTLTDLSNFPTILHTSVESSVDYITSFVSQTFPFDTRNEIYTSLQLTTSESDTFLAPSMRRISNEIELSTTFYTFSNSQGMSEITSVDMETIFSSFTEHMSSEFHLSPYLSQISTNLMLSSLYSISITTSEDFVSTEFNIPTFSLQSDILATSSTNLKVSDMTPSSPYSSEIFTESALFSTVFTDTHLIDSIHFATLSNSLAVTSSNYDSSLNVSESYVSSTHDMSTIETEMPSDLQLTYSTITLISGTNLLLTDIIAPSVYNTSIVATELGENSLFVTSDTSLPATENGISSIHETSIMATEQPTPFLTSYMDEPTFIPSLDTNLLAITAASISYTSITPTEEITTIVTTAEATPVTPSLTSEPTSTPSTTTIPSCGINHCKNGGVCRQDIFGVFCQCPAGYIGPSCETESTSCSGYTCQNGGICKVLLTMFNQQVPSCNCPVPYSGIRCDQELRIFFPAFHGQSYLIFDPPGFSASQTNEIVVYIKTTQSNGVILFSSSNQNTESTLPDAPFIQLFLQQGRLQYRFSCDGLIVSSIETDEMVNTGDMYEIVVRQMWPSKAGDWCSASIRVNENTFVGAPVLVTREPQQLGDIILGGYLRNHDTNNNEMVSMEVLSGYVGCIQSLQMNGHELDIVKSAKYGMNIENCNVPVCQHDPCKNGATCHSTADDWYCLCPDGFGGDLCETKLCEVNPCLHGGSCVILEDIKDSLCVCPYGRGGALCEMELKPVMPHFSGTQFGHTSYIAFSNIHYVRDNFQMEFNMMVDKNSTDSNLIVYMGHADSFEVQNSDYFILGMYRGYLYMRFDLGSGPADLYSSEPIDLDLPVHKVKLGRDGQVGWLKLDKQNNVTGQSMGLLTSLNVEPYLYVGGVERFGEDLIPGILWLQNGLKGCVYNLKIGTFHTDMMPPGSPPGHVEKGRNVRECSAMSCDQNPCQNDAECIDVGASIFCNCTVGWRGIFCDEELSICDMNHTCVAGSTCVPTLAGGYKCLCPLGRKGDNCDQEIIISDAMFQGEESHTVFEPIYIKKSFSIRLQIKPTKSTGLLFYAALRLHSNAGDFLSITLMDWAVMLRFSLGSELNIVRSGTKLIEDEWQTIQAGRNSTHCYVSVNGSVTEAEITGNMLHLDVTTHFYLGGLPDLSLASPLAFTDEPSAYEGCVRELVVNDKVYEMTNEGAVSGCNILDCDGTPCGHVTCKNGGKCHVMDNTTFNCTCTDGYYGDICTLPVECRSHDCNHGDCLPRIPYTCRCHLGWAGEYCDRAVEIGQNASFTGDSYLVYKIHEDIPINNSATQISLWFRSTRLHGLIFWHGQTYTDDEDYLGLGLFEGRVKLVWNLGWYSRTESLTNLRYNDGDWHFVNITRQLQEMSLSVDGTIYMSRVSGDFHHLDTGLYYYIGGFEDGTVQQMTLDNYNEPYDGCIKDFTITGKLLSFNEMEDGRSVDPCDVV